jgi:hypothetical protein
VNRTVLSTVALTALASVLAAQSFPFPITNITPPDSGDYFTVEIILPNQLEKPATNLSTPLCFSLPAGNFTKIRSLQVQNGESWGETYGRAKMELEVSGGIAPHGRSLFKRLDILSPYAGRDAWKEYPTDLEGGQTLCVTTIAIPATMDVTWRLEFEGK